MRDIGWSCTIESAKLGEVWASKWVYGLTVCPHLLPSLLSWLLRAMGDKVGFLTAVKSADAAVQKKIIA